MHPAPSIIIFTTLSGLGFGLVAFLGLGALDAGGGAMVAGAALAAALAVSGLGVSLFHLGHPERAWRALTQWRSSWLSREGVLSTGTLVAFGVFALLRTVLGLEPRPLGWISAALASATVYATAMIYGSLRTVPVWNHPLTPAVYLAFAGAGGALLSALLARLFQQPAATLELSALALLLAAWALKAVWWSRALQRGFGGSTPETATGLGRIGRVRLFEAPHTSPNYLMREMVFVVGRRHARRLRRIAWASGAGLPLLATGLSYGLGGAWPLLLLAAASYVVGLLAERWLFFAEARHSVALYYGHGEERPTAVSGHSPHSRGSGRSPSRRS